MSRVFEILWFVIAIFSFGLGIKQMSSHGLENSYQLFIIATVALLLFLFRRKLRKSNKGNNP